MKRKNFTQKEREQVYKKCHGHCAYCGAEIKFKEMQVDHFIPISLYAKYGKPGTDANDMINLMPSCASCNHYKSTLRPENFRNQLSLIPSRLEKHSTYNIAKRFGLVEAHEKKIQFYFETM